MPAKGARIQVTGTSGKTYEYVWTNSPADGAMKVVYFSPDKSYVVAFYKKPQDANAIERLENLVGLYRKSIFDQIGGDYWRNIYCWPTDLVKEGNRVGLIVPAYDKKFFFQHPGSLNTLKGEEKNGAWFVNPAHHFMRVDPRETGDWRSYFNISLLLARGVRRMHAQGLSHSDLSYKNVLIDPVSQSTVIIDIDGLVVPGKYPPDVLGTPDFIAPEIYATGNLDISKRALPCRTTDLHALAVLVYMYLLCRHPLRGRQIWDVDDEKHDEMLSMGEKALFIEHPTDRSNRYDVQWVRDEYPRGEWPYLFPWRDLDNLPYTTLGPHLSKLVEQAFITGLHKPNERPTADAWEDALVRTMDLLHPCTNPKCRQKWFVFDNAKQARCPFCGQTRDEPIPVLNLFTPYGAEGTYKPENWRVTIFNGTRIYPWHAHREIFPNEKITDEQRKALACFQFYNGVWYLRNERAAGMQNLGEGERTIPVGSALPLKDGMRLLLDGAGSRIIQVQMANGET